MVEGLKLMFQDCYSFEVTLTVDLSEMRMRNFNSCWQSNTDRHSFLRDKSPLTSF
jgi:hypothetical protein